MDSISEGWDRSLEDEVVGVPVGEIVRGTRQVDDTSKYRQMRRSSSTQYLHGTKQMMVRQALGVTHRDSRDSNVCSTIHRPFIPRIARSNGHLALVWKWIGRVGFCLQLVQLCRSLKSSGIMAPAAPSIGYLDETHML